MLLGLARACGSTSTALSASSAAALLRACLIADRLMKMGGLRVPFPTELPRPLAVVPVMHTQPCMCIGGLIQHTSCDAGCLGLERARSIKFKSTEHTQSSRRHLGFGMKIQCKGCSIKKTLKPLLQACLVLCGNQDGKRCHRCKQLQCLTCTDCTRWGLSVGQTCRCCCRGPCYMVCDPLLKPPEHPRLVAALQGDAAGEGLLLWVVQHMQHAMRPTSRHTESTALSERTAGSFCQAVATASRQGRL